LGGPRLPGNSILLLHKVVAGQSGVKKHDSGGERGNAKEEIAKSPQQSPLLDPTETRSELSVNQRGVEHSNRPKKRPDNEREGTTKVQRGKKPTAKKKGDP